MLVYSRKRKILELIADAEFPFWQLVARGDLRESLTVDPEEDPALPAIESMVREVMDDQKSRMKVVLGKVGGGKTLLFWRLVKKFGGDLQFVFVPVPMVKEKLVLHVYSQLVEAMGIDRIRELISNLSSGWGGHQKVYGLYRSTNMERVIADGFREEGALVHAPAESVLQDCVRVIVMADMDPEKKFIAERWILGEPMDINDLDLLGVPNDLRNDETSLVMLQVILNHLHLCEGPDHVLFFFDELEKAPPPLPGDVDDGGDPSEDSQTQRAITPTSILEVIALLLEYTRNSILVATCDVGEWNRVSHTIPVDILELGFTNAVELPTFTTRDFLRLVESKLGAFWSKAGIDLARVLPAHLNRDDVLPYFPFTRQQLTTIYNLTQGFPRESLRLLKKVLYQIAYDSEFDFERLLQNIEHFIS
ncbi:MAG: hypothetical protein ACTSU5_07160 [Promethearchaeota archaeon]